jgi:GTPase involved in cell partitioning and DNA repair
MTTAETKVAKWGFTTLGVSALGWYMIASLTFLVVAADI